MVIEDIYSFIGNPIIISRGAEYYRKNKVIQFDKDVYEGENGFEDEFEDEFRDEFEDRFEDEFGDKFTSDIIIHASVQGSVGSPYQVEIFLDKDENIETAYCTCPYFQSNIANCKHIAAVLIYYLEESRVVKNPIISNKDKFASEEIINLEKVSKNRAPGFAYIDYIKNITEPSSRTEAKQRYKLVFVITYNGYGSNYRYEYEYSKWTIEPKLRYIKKNHDLGRFEKFKDYKLTEPISEPEKILLYSLLDKNEGFKENTPLIHHFNFLTKNKISNLYLREGYTELPVYIEEIKKLNIMFVLKGHTLQEDLYEFAPVIEVIGKKGHKIDFITKPSRIIFDGCTTIFISREGYIFYKENHQLYYALLKAFHENNFKLTYNEIKELISYFKNKNSKEISIIFQQKTIKKISPIPLPFIEIEPHYNELKVALFFNYNGYDVFYHNTDPAVRDCFVSFNKNRKDSIILIKRNRNYESRIDRFFKNRFKSILTSLSDYGVYKVNIAQLDFLAQYGNEILKEGIEIRIKGEKERITKRAGSISVSVSSGIDWFDIKADYLDAGGNITDIQIDLDLLHKGLLKIENSYTIIKKEDIQKLQMLLQEGMDKDGKLKVSKYNFHIIDELYHDIRNNRDKDILTVHKISQQLKNFKKIEQYPLPRKFHGTLRKYQEAGYSWLHFLNKYNLNGCLADDMGLGKTIQLLSLFQKLKEEKKLKISLIVVPVNTIANWESEILRFTPGLKYLLHFGQKRIKDINYLKKHDVILVSYHTLRNDIQTFDKIDYHYMVLDESQNIKNYKSLVFKAVRTLKAEYRLSLTGTPVENNTLELWSQMDFLNPGLLGNVEKFRREFTNPIEAKKDTEATERLRKLIFPFLLRRKKEDVLKDLPSQSENILYSQMEENQAKIYEQQKEYYRALITGLLEDEGKEKAGIKIFAALLKLRQTALFPVLADKKFKNIPSCKYDQLINVVNEILEEDHKILLFSQFVKTLSIIKKYFDRKNMKYSYIDGSVSPLKRRETIMDFQEKEDIKVFLLSLKAGGVGVNLTAADYVIIFDPWWNPAVESQAVDRAHRIGQKRKVIVYKMIVKDTIEEKMLKLQEKKKNLVENLITTEGSFFKSLSKKDIIDLFN